MNLLSDIQRNRLETLSVNETADILWKYPADKFLNGHMSVLSLIKLTSQESRKAFLYKDCLLAPIVYRDGRTHMISLPLSVNADRSRELEVVEDLLNNEIGIIEIPKISFDSFFQGSFKGNALPKLITAPQSFFKASEASAMAGARYKQLRKIKNNELYRGLTAEYITSSTVTGEHFLELNRMTDLWVNMHMKRKKERGDNSAWINKSVIYIFKGIRALTYNNSWMLLILRDKQGIPVIYSLTERINPAYVYLTAGKAHPETQEAYPDLARYIYMLEVDYWSNLQGMSPDLIFTSGIVGDVGSLRNRDIKNKPIDDWDYNKPDSYIYKDLLAEHKRTLRPSIVCPSVNITKASWAKNKAVITKGIF